MTKKTYEKPVLQAEQFIPNNYCNVCWGVACAAADRNNITLGNNTVYPESERSIGWGTTWEYAWGNVQGSAQVIEKNVYEVGHRSDYCGTKTNQYISKDENGVYSLHEVNTDGLSTLEGDLDSSNSYTSGSIIKWTTKSGSKTWHHWGYVDLTDTSRPNMS